MSPLRVALLIAAKDLRQRFRDRSALIFAIVAPLGLALIFSRLIGPAAAVRGGGHGRATDAR